MAEWRHTLKGFAEIFDNENGCEARARLIVRKLDRFQNQNGEDYWLESIIEDFNIFEEDDGVDYFDRIMAELYDWADNRRVWIEPRGVVK